MPGSGEFYGEDHEVTFTKPEIFETELTELTPGSGKYGRLPTAAQQERTRRELALAANHGGEQSGFAYPHLDRLEEESKKSPSLDSESLTDDTLEVK